MRAVQAKGIQARPVVSGVSSGLRSSRFTQGASTFSGQRIVAPKSLPVVEGPKPRVSSVKVQANAAAATAKPTPPFKWGADMKSLGICVAVGLLIWVIPPPAGVTTLAWHLLAIFLGTIVGIITKPLPLGAVAMVGLGVAIITNTLPFTAAFSAFASEIPWLIAIAFFLSTGFIKSGLGSRIAYGIVAAFGKTTLGLTYSLVFAEALLAPAIPSLAARAGGIFFPLAQSLCLACGSDPKNGTEGKLGSYIMKTSFQCTCVSSAMFITGMAANPLAVNLAAEAGVGVISWGAWAIAAFVPGIISLIVAPLVLYAIYPPEVKDTPDAPVKAKEELAKMGPLTLNEKITAVALGITVVLWVMGGAWGVNAVGAALVGLSIMMVTNLVTWKECLEKGEAWDTLTWFAALIAMAAYLNKYGLIPWFSQQVVAVVGSMGLSWEVALAVVTLIYFYSHYFFASAAAHIGAMFTAFLSVAIACGAPGNVAALLLGFMSSLMGCTTTYGLGSAPSYFGGGYVPQGKWYSLGFIMSLVYLAIWLGIGPIWWKAIGLF